MAIPRAAQTQRRTRIQEEKEEQILEAALGSGAKVVLVRDCQQLDTEEQKRLAAGLGRSCCWQRRQADEGIIAHCRDCFQRHVA